MHVQCSQRPEGELDPLELELWADVSCLIWILRTESRSPAIAASVVNFWIAQARFVWSEVKRSRPIMMGGSVAEEYQAVAWSNISKPGNSNRSKNRVLIPASRFIPLPQESTSSCSSSTTSPKRTAILEPCALLLHEVWGTFYIQTVSILFLAPRSLPISRCKMNLARSLHILNSFNTVQRPKTRAREKLSC